MAFHICVIRVDPTVRILNIFVDYKTFLRQMNIAFNFGREPKTSCIEYLLYTAATNTLTKDRELNNRENGLFAYLLEALFKYVMEKAAILY